MIAPDRSRTVPAETPPDGPTGQQARPVPSGGAAEFLPCATPGCGHSGLVHDIGTRRGVRVRTACSTSSGPHATPCPCRQFTPEET